MGEISCANVSYVSIVVESGYRNMSDTDDDRNSNLQTATAGHDDWEGPAPMDAGKRRFEPMSRDDRS